MFLSPNRLPSLLSQAMAGLLYTHLPKNLLLILLSLLFLPLDTYILSIAYLLRPFLNRSSPARHHVPPSHRRTILITGISMTKALTLARLFHAHGHRVIGADASPLAAGRFSRALHAFHTLSPPTPSGDPGPYIGSLLAIIGAVRADLWVSCSGVASAIEDGVAAEVIASRAPYCRAVQFGVADTRALHEKDGFVARTRELGLRVPETRTVRSRADMIAVLRQCVGLAARGRERAAEGRKFIAKSVGMDDKSRGDLTLLPRATEKETREHVERLDVGADRPWIVQEFVRGKEYCTHSLVVRGRVRAFVACPSAELLMHYCALPEDSPLSLAMLAFTERQAEAGGERFTGHLSFDFLVKDEDSGKLEPEDIRLYPIECNPRAHTADILFDHSEKLVEAYLSVLQEPSASTNGSRTNGAGTNGLSTTSSKRRDIVTPNCPRKHYWIGHDLVQLLLLPVLSLLTGQMAIGEAWMSVRDFIEHVLFWKDGTFELWDPLPWWWLYHVYWPMQFVDRIQTGRKWSRVNVSTTKMFDCE